MESCRHNEGATRRVGWLHAKLHQGEGFTLELNLCATRAGKVDDDVSALSRGQLEMFKCDGGGEQSLVGADLVHLAATRKREEIKPAVSGVENPKSVGPRL